MKISIGNYIITSDTYNFVVTKYVRSRKGKNKGKDMPVIQWFYSWLPHALEKIISEKCKESTAQTLAGLSTELKELSERIKAAFKINPTELRPIKEIEPEFNDNAYDAEGFKL